MVASTYRLSCLVLVGWMILLSATWTEAHQGAGDGPPDAATWVRQALAFLELRPPNIGEAAERLEGALKARDTQGVDLTLVREAVAALKAKNPESAATALIRALLPPSPRAPQVTAEGRPASSSPRADEDVAAHHLPGAPLKAIEFRFMGSPGEYLLLGLGGVLMAAGLFTLRKTARRGSEGLR